MPRAACLLLFALGCLARLAGAAEPLEISATVGFADLFRPGHWTPINVSVLNRGADLRAELEVAVTGDDPALKRPTVSHHRLALDLPRDARKRVQFTVLPQSLAHPLVVRVRAGGREIAASELDLRARFAAERFLVVLSRRVELDYLSDGAVDGLRVVHPHPELLPAHWRGYDAVAAVIVHGVTLESLTEAQHEALRKWIAQGGILAVSGGADPSLLKSPRLSALLPVTPAGTIALEPDALRQAFPALQVTRALHVHRSAGVRGEVRLRAGDTVLIAESTLGRGRVLYLGFDVSSPPFDRWEGMRALWLEHLRLPTPAGAAGNPPATQGGSALAALVRAEATDFPGNATALLFLLLYLGALLAAQTLAQGAQRGAGFAALRTWGPPLAFAPLAWLLFGPAAFPRGATAASIAMIEPIAGSGYARVELELGLYATRGGALTFEYGGADPILIPHRDAQRDGRMQDWIFGQGAHRYVEPLARRRYLVHALDGEDVIRFPLRAALERREAGLRLRLENASGHGLQDAWLVFAGHTYALGDIAPGAHVERDLATPAQAAETNDALWRRLPKPPAGAAAHLPQAAQMLLERRARMAGEQGYPRAGHALLLGYAPSPLQPMGASRDWPRHERALLAFEVEATTRAVAATTPAAAAPAHIARRGEGAS